MSGSIHSAEWLADLRMNDPEQAQHTAKLLEKAASIEVCSFCGDHPATDYRMAQPNVHLGISTFKICKECLNLRVLAGYKFTPLP